MAETLEDDAGRARVLASGGRRELLPEGAVFTIAGTPCAPALRGDVDTEPMVVIGFACVA